MLGNDERSLDGFPETNFIREENALRKRSLKGEKSGIDLMGIHVYLRRR